MKIRELKRRYGKKEVFKQKDREIRKSKLGRLEVRGIGV